VAGVFSQTDYDELFPNRHVDAPTYDDFLSAVSLYPMFCGEFYEDGHVNRGTLEETCKRELSFLFAHIIFKSGGYWLNKNLVDIKYEGMAYMVDEWCRDQDG
jgi:hypothetical protein